MLCSILAVTLIAYAPMVYSIILLSKRTTQALNAFVLLVFAFLDSWKMTRRTYPFILEINHHGIMLFSLSCVALAAASWTWIWPLAVLGLCLNVAALLSFCFGREGVRPFYPALAGLGLAVAMLLFVPRVDGLLRIFAGKCSAGILGLLGFEASVEIQQVPFAVTVVAERGAQMFDVATECNGFGIILSSVVLVVIFAIRQRHPWYLKAAWLVLALASGLIFNTIRIVAISIVTMRSKLDYTLVHEGVGTLVYLVALAVVYFGVTWSGRASTASSGARLDGVSRPTSV